MRKAFEKRREAEDAERRLREVAVQLSEVFSIELRGEILNVSILQVSALEMTDVGGEAVALVPMNASATEVLAVKPCMCCCPVC